MNQPPLAALLCRRWPTRWNTFTFFAGALVAAWPLSAPAQPQPQRLNNLTALLMEAAPTSTGEAFSFTGRVGVFPTVGQTIEDRYGRPCGLRYQLLAGPLADLKSGLNSIRWP